MMRFEPSTTSISGELRETGPFQSSKLYVRRTSTLLIVTLDWFRVSHAPEALRNVGMMITAWEPVADSSKVFPWNDSRAALCPPSIGITFPFCSTVSIAKS
jgi:hypothetical protein